ncbi:MAG TPA: hypothetical protein PLJ21_06030 [Pseudobdellovibrionaceae bacterium]|nr:hypothetical protein [Pseudobdellovibrionaceae bacterium]
MSEEEEAHFATLSLKEVTTFEYLAEDKRRLVKSILQVWQEAIPELLSQLNKLNTLEKRLGFLDQVKTLGQSMDSIESNLGDSWLAATTWSQDAFQLKRVFLLLEIQLNTLPWVKLEPIFKRKFSESLRLCLKSFGELDTLLGYAEDTTNDSTNNSVDRSREGH